MKKNLIIMACAILFSTAVYAGNNCRPIGFSPCQLYFVELESGYSWNTLKDIDINIIGAEDVHASASKNGWSGRIALGLGKQVCAPFYITSEIGWGYYGDSILLIKATGPLVGAPGAPDFNGIRLKSTQDGFDILAGVLYNQPCYELFLKAGALIQNSQLDLDADISAVTTGNMQGNVSIGLNQTQVLPEVKIGGVYHVNCNLGVLVDWTYAFGSNTRIQANIDPNNPLGTINMNLKNPSLNTVMVGLQYRFV